MELLTRVETEAFECLAHNDHVVTMGSCFAEYIGQKLQRYKWNCLKSHFGTLFHPINLFKLIGMSQEEQCLDPHGFVSYDGAIFHHDLPSTLWGSSKEDLSERFKRQAERLSESLQQAHYLFLTLGTALVYEHCETKNLVGNCHRQPRERFIRRLLSLDEIERSWQRLLPHLPPDLHIVWTISPVRHLKETLSTNSASKGLLRYWVETRCLVESKKELYFPAYELMMDELRDYRFYNEDLLHPNQLALEYIWERFLQKFCRRDAQQFCEEWTQILRRLEHRPMRAQSKSYHDFLEETLRQLDKFPELNLAEEKAQLRLRFLELP